MRFSSALARALAVLFVALCCARSQESAPPAFAAAESTAVPSAGPSAGPSGDAPPSSAATAPPEAALPSAAPPTPSLSPSAPPVAPSASPQVSEMAVVLAAPHAPPRILTVALSASVVRGGQIVVGRVRTTSNVASVEVRVEGFSTVMTHRSAGDFTLNYSVPVLPPWLHRKYPVQVIARNVDGVSETRTLEITLE